MRKAQTVNRTDVLLREKVALDYCDFMFLSELTLKSSMLRVLMKLPLLSLTAMEDADLNKGDVRGHQDRAPSYSSYKTTLRHPLTHHLTFG